MKAIRWSGLLAFLVLSAIIVAAGLFSGVVIKPVLESKFTEMNGARVDIDSVNIDYSPFALNINNIQIADPSEPMINTAQINQVKLVLSFGRMLMGQLVIDEASVKGIQIETPRKKSGLIVKSSAPETEQKKGEDFSFDIPGFDLPNIDELLAKEPLQSEVLTKKLDEDLAEIDKQWVATRNDLPDSKKINTYEQRFNVIKKTAKGNTAQKLSAVKDAKTLIKELKAETVKIKKARSQLSDDIKHINKSLKEVKAAPANDIKRIKGKYSLDAAGAENVSKMLFGSKVTSYLSMAEKWYSRVKPYLGSDDEKVEPVIERSKGIDIKFKEHNPKPDFYVRVASVTADLPRGQFEGSVADISSDQSINRKPMRFKLQGVSMVGKEREAIYGLFNYIDKSNSFTKINYELRKAKIDQFVISKSSQLPLEMKSALMTLNVDARFQDGGLDGAANTQFTQVNFEADSSSMFASAFKSVSDFNINTTFSGEIGNMSMRIDSNLDNQLGQQLKNQLAKKKEKFEVELKARIDEKLSEPLERINAKKKELEAIKQRIDNSEKQLQQKIAALKQTIDKEGDLKKDKAKDKAKDKLKEKLKGKFGF